MAFCEDPSLTYLNRLGYNVVRLPRTGLLPLEVLGCEIGRPPEPIGPLPSVWQSALAPPPVTLGDASTVTGKSTSNIKIGFRLKILEGVLGAMGAAVPQVSLAYSRARTVRFEFKEPEIKKIDPLVVGNYLAKGDLNTANPVVQRYMLSDETQAYIITEVLLSKAIRVVALDESETSAKLDLKMLQDGVGANVEVKAIGAEEGDVTYQGKQFLAFGYKAHEIVYSGKEWNVRRLEPSEETALFGDEERKLAPPVLFRGNRFMGPASRGQEVGV
jgi:hypothetical protein